MDPETNKPFLNPETGRPMSLGCWCPVYEKARYKRAQCWARENGLDFGWVE